MRQTLIPILLILLFSITSAQALQTNFNCPESVELNQEFTCNLDISEAEGIWDVKVEILNEGSNTAKIYNVAEQKWKSAYYYLKGFISKGETKEIKLKIESTGNFQGTLKLRQNTKKETSNFQINVGDSQENTEEQDEEEEKIEDSQGTPLQIEEEPKMIEQTQKQTISLNGNTINSPDNELIYKSKSQKALDYAPYAFSIFLIIIISILLWDKF